MASPRPGGRGCHPGCAGGASTAVASDCDQHCARDSVESQPGGATPGASRAGHWRQHAPRGCWFRGGESGWRFLGLAVIVTGLPIVFAGLMPGTRLPTGCGSRRRSVRSRWREWRCSLAMLTQVRTKGSPPRGNVSTSDVHSSPRVRDQPRKVDSRGTLRNTKPSDTCFVTRNSSPLSRSSPRRYPHPW